MSERVWRYAFTSVTGTSHHRSGQGCQDASDCQLLQTEDGREVLVAVASDGAGSASNGGDGAAIACRLFIREMRDLVEVGSDVPDITEDFARGWLETFQSEIDRQAEAVNLTSRDYACTILAAVVGEQHSVFLQVGDGVMVVATSDNPDEYRWVFWPQRGEYENTTTFATDPTALQSVMYRLVDWPVEEVAVLTDGLQHLALHYSTHTAHTPFFTPMFAPLHGEPSGLSAPLSNSLSTFLQSSTVNARTDDDKTLILASRRISAPSVPEKEADDDALL